jgi:hypothetical protein
VRGAEAPTAAGAHVHLLHDRPFAPPLRDQLRIRPDREDIVAGSVEGPFDTDLDSVGVVTSVFIVLLS